MKVFRFVTLIPALVAAQFVVSAAVISVAPTAIVLSGGQTAQFSSTITGTNILLATWSVNGIVGGNSTVGVVSSSGLYTAPAVISSSRAVTVTATTVATPQVSASVSVTLAPVQISVSPVGATLQAGTTQQFTATVTGSTNTAAVWSISPAVGSISTRGFYTAPASITLAQTVTVTAISSADSTKKATATVSLQPAAMTISMSPASATLQAGKTQQFSATVTGSTNTAAVWSISPAVGSISTSGLYTAPTSITLAQTVTVTATSSADSTKKATATVSLQPAVVTISMSPTSASLQAGKTQQFTATVAGSTNTAATWSISPAVGSISSSGLYTAPASITLAQTVTVTATSSADSTKKATATVSLQPAVVTISMSPTSASLQAGKTQQFSATVAGSTNTAATWSISPAVGSISTTGLYTAPASITLAQTVTVTATSSADSTKKATATVSLQPAVVTISMSPASASLQAGKTQQFSATVAGSTNTAAVWSISPAVGSISSSGLYTAPASITLAQTVTVTATSSADSTKKATATVTLQPAAVTISMSPTSTTLQAGKTQQFRATVAGSTNTAATWSISPAVGSISTSGLYTAPALITLAQTVTVTATSSADSTKKATATVSLQPAVVTISMSPASASLQAGKTQQFSATVAGSTNTAATWSISPAVGSISTTGLYTAPALITVAQTVTVTATSSADSTKKATATVSLEPAVVTISMSPASATLQAGKTQQFSATVAGSTNTAATWSISPAVGSISTTGLYTAPALITLAQTVTVTATSSADSTKKATATVSLQPAVVTISMSPASASLQAGKTQQFSATVAGSTNTAATWSISPAVGSISTSGLYTAPASITLAQSVTVTAASSADSTKKATATVALQATLASQAASTGGSGPTIITSSLTMGYLQRTYTSVLTGSGGTAPYTWSITSGQLPSGLTLNSSNGQITGTPSQGGQFAVTFGVKDASGATGSSAYTLQVFEQATDLYGGLLSLPCSNGSKTHFYTQKIGSRWHFCTPAGNAFWMNGVYTVDASDTSTDYQGISLAGMRNTKYAQGVTTDPTLNWALQSVRRLKSWGFTADNEYSSVYLWPTAVDFGWNGQSADNTIPEKLPFTLIVNANEGAMANTSNYANGPIKELFAGIKPGVYTAYQGATTADLVDPNYALWLKNYLANDYLVHQAITSNHNDYLVGFTVDESDQMWGFATGADFPTVADGVVSDGYEQPHLGWVILVTAPTQSGYADPKVYSKAMLSTWLASRYGNNIAALNAAWGSSYTSFGSAGGWGSGSGILDEDGTCPSKKSGQACWVSSDSIHLAGITATMKSDLDAFLFSFASSYFSTVKTTLNQAAPGILYMGTLIGGWGTPPRIPILQAAAQYVDVLQIVQIPPNCSNCTDMQQRIDFVDQYGGDKPWLQWDGYAANADSYMSPWPTQFGGAEYPTQQARGQVYQQRMTQYLSSKGSTSGTYHTVGFEWWDFYDMRGEQLNWGLLTPRDDPYDGVSATTQTGADSWGYPTGCVTGLGCEKANYGDFLTAVRAANLNALRTIASGQ